MSDARGPEERLEALEASISRLMRGLNHDLKNPLGAANGYLELLAEGVRGEVSTEQRETIERAAQLVESAMAIVDDVVTYARASLGELDVRLADTDLDALSRLVVEEHRARARKEDVELRFTPSGDGARTVTDAGRVSQILRQLLANALDHTPAGGSIEVAVERAHERVAVAVHDTGPGIPAEERDRVFLEFEQGDPPQHERTTAGVGFGLPLARALADRLDGRLAIRSKVGTGSTFELTLPVRAEVKA